MFSSDGLNENTAESPAQPDLRSQKGTKDEIDALRAGIDEVDEGIVRLLDRRARLARRIGEIKQKNGLEAYAPARERAVLDRVAALGAGVELEPQATVADVFTRVERGDAGHGIVPVENSMEGAVTHTLDELMNSPLKICGEVYLPVSQNLISSEPSLDRVRVICSHPMALAQAAAWLRHHLPGARLEEVGSTAEAARRAVSEPGVAAVGSVLAAEAHHLNVLARSVQDARANATRFIVLGRAWAGRTGRDKTSVVFSVKDRPGVLRDALAAFAEEGINLTRIESRPSRKRAWTYVFFADFDGHPEEERVQRALAALEEHCPYVSLIGAYPAVSPEMLD